MSSTLPAGLTPIDPGTVRKPYPGQAGPTGSGDGTMSYDDIKSLAAWAGAGKYAGIMARMALAESAGNPRSNVDHKTSYVENGKTYYPEGLWQISTVHGTGGGSMFSALANVRQAVQLFKAQGFSPWEASRHGGAGGGWGQYLQSELGPNAGFGSTRGGGGGNEDLYQGMVADANLPAGLTPIASPSALPAGLTPIASASPDDTLPAGLTPIHPQTGGISQIPGRLYKDVKHLVTNQPVEPHSPFAKFEAGVHTQWDKATRHPMDWFYGVMGASSRMGMSVVSDVGHGKDLQSTVKDLWHSIWHGEEAETQKLTAGVEDVAHNIVGLPTHQAIDKWVKQYVPKDWQGMAASTIKGGEDFGIQALADPVTYTGVGDFAKGLEFARNLKYLHPLFAGGWVAHQAWKVAEGLGIKDLSKHLQEVNGVYDVLAKAVGEGYKTFKTRPDLDVYSAETKQVRMQIEGRARQQFTAGLPDIEQSLTSGDPEKAKTLFLNYFLRNGSPKNATMAGKMLGYSGDALEKMVGKTTNSIREADLKDALTMFMEKEHPDETAAQLLQRRMGVLKGLRDESIKGRVASETEEYVQALPTTPTAGVTAKQLADYARDKKVDVANLPTQGRNAFDAFPLFKLTRNLQRAAIKLNPFPHAIKNVGELAYLAGGPRTVLEGIAHGASNLETKLYGSAAADVERYGPYAGQSMMQRLRTIGGSAPEHDYELEGLRGGSLRGQMTQAMTKIENGWRQAVLDMLDRRQPTRWGTKFEERDELLKGAIVNDRLGDYRNQSAFVRLFESMGGPFIAFRMGIVPRNIIHALKDDPARVIAIARAQYDVNANRKGRHDNELLFHDPVTDFAKMLSNPIGYAMTSLSLPQALQQEQGVGDSWLEQATHMAGQYVPGFSMGEDMVRNAMGVSMPGPGKGHQSMSLGDHIAVGVLTILGMYFHELSSQKTERRRGADINKLGD